jgi:hypothetical protein
MTMNPAKNTLIRTVSLAAAAAAAERKNDG